MLAPQTSSGDIGTTSVCYDIAAPIAGYQVSSLMSRSFTVNGMAVVPPATFPPAMAGRYVVVFGAGTPAFTAWSYWR
jgi:hypothetical protein